MSNSQNLDKTIIHDKSEATSIREENLSMSTTHFSRKSLAGRIPIVQKAYLEVYGVGNSPLGFELNDSEVLIGRKSTCQLNLPLFGVSRVHARIFIRNEEYFIEDSNSTNGTFVNTIRIIKCILRNNDQIEIGEAKIIFVEEKTRREI